MWSWTQRSPIRWRDQQPERADADDIFRSQSSLLLRGLILDDATSEIYYAQLAEEETTATVMVGLRAAIEGKGLFCSLYSDRGAHFWYTPKSGGKVDYERPTQVGRAMKELGVNMIPSYSPQAGWGRPPERNFSTWQG